MATKAGVVQAVFPEGGLTRDGRLRPPKMGLLSYMVSGFDPSGPRDVVFIPVGLNYDRVLEDRILTSAIERQASASGGTKDGGAEASGQAQRKGRTFRFRPGAFAGFLFRSLWLALRGKWYRYGYACVSFGKPISLRDYLKGRGLDFRTLDQARRFEEIERLGHHLMDAVGRVVPALPVSLVATAFLDAGGRALTAFELKSEVHNLMSRLEAGGAHVHIPRADREYAVEVGLRMLTLRRLVLEEDGLLRANPEEALLLGYYANAIAHLLPGADVGGRAQEAVPDGPAALSPAARNAASGPADPR